jgi:hypothetical protein
MEIKGLFMLQCLRRTCSVMAKILPESGRYGSYGINHVPRNAAAQWALIAQNCDPHTASVSSSSLVIHYTKRFNGKKEEAF